LLKTAFFQKNQTDKTKKWTGRELNPRPPPLSAQSMRRRHSYQTELPAPLVSFESRKVFNSIEWSARRREKKVARFVWALHSYFWHAELLFSSLPCSVFVLLFALFAVVDECTRVAWAVLLPFLYLFGFFSEVVEGVSVYVYSESAVVAYEEAVFAP
jgi:hypothetical protein